MQRMNGRDIQCLLLVQWWQQAGQAGGEHAFATAGWATQEHGMSARSGHFQGPPTLTGHLTIGFKIDYRVTRHQHLPLIRDNSP